MALDTSASDVALGQLSNLPLDYIFSAPLKAAINAQAIAAQSTVDFIRAVGMQEVNGKLEAIDVAFTYQDGAGTYRNLKVPAILLYPIPYIVIDTVDIDFKARISASAQQSSEDHSSTEANVGVKGTASWGGKRFGASIEVNASYSSKKDSKASQDSKYSVEYTLDIHIHASQAGMPQGMVQIFNILQDSITNKPEAAASQIQVFGLPPVIAVSATETLSEDFTVIALNEAGDAAGFTITLALDPVGVLSATAPGAANPAKVTLSNDTKLDLATLPQDLNLTITAKPAKAGDPDIVVTRPIRVIAA